MRIVLPIDMGLGPGMARRPRAPTTRPLTTSPMRYSTSHHCPTGAPGERARPPRGGGEPAEGADAEAAHDEADEVQRVPPLPDRRAREPRPATRWRGRGGPPAR